MNMNLNYYDACYKICALSTILGSSKENVVAINDNLISPPPNDSFLNIRFPKSIIVYIIANIRMPLPIEYKTLINGSINNFIIIIII